MQRRSFFPRWLLISIVIVGCVNFLAFIAVSLLIGGEATNGFVENGRFFLRGLTGDPVEVSARTYMYSKTHGLSLFVTHPLLLLAWFVLIRHRMSFSAV